MEQVAEEPGGQQIVASIMTTDSERDSASMSFNVNKIPMKLDEIREQERALSLQMIVAEAQSSIVSGNAEQGRRIPWGACASPYEVTRKSSSDVEEELMDEDDGDSGWCGLSVSFTETEDEEPVPGSCDDGRWPWGRYLSRRRPEFSLDGVIYEEIDWELLDKLSFGGNVSADVVECERDLISSTFSGHTKLIEFPSNKVYHNDAYAHSAESSRKRNKRKVEAQVKGLLSALHVAQTAAYQVERKWSASLDSCDRKQAENEILRSRLKKVEENWRVKFNPMLAENKGLKSQLDEKNTALGSARNALEIQKAQILKLSMEANSAQSALSDERAQVLMLGTEVNCTQSALRKRRAEVMALRLEIKKLEDGKNVLLAAIEQGKLDAQRARAAQARKDMDAAAEREQDATAQREKDALAQREIASITEANRIEKLALNSQLEDLTRERDVSLLALKTEKSKLEGDLQVASIAVQAGKVKLKAAAFEKQLANMTIAELKETHKVQLEQVTNEMKLLKFKIRQEDQLRDMVHGAKTLIQQMDNIRSKKRKLKLEFSSTGEEINCLEAAQEENLCQICFINPNDTISSPCLHLHFCFQCLEDHRKRSNTCPTCQTPINRVFRATSSQYPCIKGNDSLISVEEPSLLGETGDLVDSDQETLMLEERAGDVVGNLGDDADESTQQTDSNERPSGKSGNQDTDDESVEEGKQKTRQKRQKALGELQLYARQDSTSSRHETSFDLPGRTQIQTLNSVLNEGGLEARSRAGKSRAVPVEPTEVPERSTTKRRKSSQTPRQIGAGNPVLRLGQGSYHDESSRFAIRDIGKWAPQRSASKQERQEGGIVMLEKLDEGSTGSRQLTTRERTSGSSRWEHGRREQVADKDSVTILEKNTALHIKDGRGKKNKIIEPVGREKKELSWLLLTETEAGTTHYIPQYGDDVVYLRQGHQEFLDKIQSKETGPWHTPKFSIRAVEFCNIIELEYSILEESRQTCCKLTLMLTDSASKAYGKSFKLTLPELATFPDFIIERSRYDSAMKKDWGPSDSCQVWRRSDDDVSGGQWWDGKVMMTKPKSPDFPESPWDRIHVIYKADLKSSEPTSHSLWELVEPGNHEHKLPHIDDENKRLILNAVHDLEKSCYVGNEDEFGLRCLRQDIENPSYLDCTPLPLDLEIIKLRLQKDYYHSLGAFRHDVQLLIANTRFYYWGDSEMVGKMERLGEFLLEVIV